MKGFRNYIPALITIFSAQHSIAGQYPGIQNNNFCVVFYNQQDSSFYGNYTAAKKETYLYSKSEPASRTKTKVPGNVAILITKKSGTFVYGEFNVSSNKSYKGWFRLADLKEILFTPPKVN